MFGTRVVWMFRTPVILCFEHPVFFRSEHLDDFCSEHPEKRFYVLYPVPNLRLCDRVFGRARTKKDPPKIFPRVRCCSSKIHIQNRFTIEYGKARKKMKGIENL